MIEYKKSGFGCFSLGGGGVARQQKHVWFVFVKIEEGKNSGMSKVKKKITEKDKRESTCQKKKKREVGNSCQVIKKPSVKM